ncbi:MAG: hypothetical protein M9942_12930 [Microthrixaceae bacterium]|nr:hypothetical protein [Microthrixaceae bacterium]
MSYYDWIELAQLVFFLVVMIAAFSGGLALGWWRWGRDASTGRGEQGAQPRGSWALFSPDSTDEIDLTLLAESAGGPAGAERTGLFTASPGGQDAPGRSVGSAQELPEATRAALEAAPGGEGGGPGAR